MRALLRLACVAFALLALSSCVISLGVGIADNLIENRAYIADSAERPLTVADARGTFLLKSSHVFYPRGIPIDPSQIPDLTDTELAGIEHMLDTELRRITATQSQHRAFLAAQFPGFDDRRAKAQIEIENQRLAVAATEQSGRMFVDAKVVQAIYRAALLSVLVDEDLKGSKEERERSAFGKFAEFSQNVEGMSPVLPLNDARGFLSAARHAKGTLEDRMDEGLRGVLQARLQDMLVVEQSQRLEGSFLGAIDFLLAHETAHLVLGHFPLTTDCNGARDREFEADRYAVLLNGLSHFDRPPVFRANILLISTPPDNYETFFRFAYGLAGFDTLLSPLHECSYPRSDLREKALHPFASMIGDVVERAKWDHAYKSMRTNGAVSTSGKSAFDDYYEPLLSKLCQESRNREFDYPTAEEVEANRDLLHALYNLYYTQ
jgi:hypothetical protein